MIAPQIDCSIRVSDDCFFRIPCYTYPIILRAGCLTGFQTENMNDANSNIGWNNTIHLFA